MGSIQSKVVALQYAAPQIEQQVAPILRTFARPVGEADELYVVPSGVAPINTGMHCFSSSSRTCS